MPLDQHIPDDRVIEAKYVEITAQIRETLAKNVALSDWSLISETSLGWQLYMIGQENESLRQVVVQRWHLTIYKDHEGGRGATTITMVESDLPQLETKLTEAIFIAGLSGNPPHPLCGPANYPEVETVDPRIVSEARVLALEMRDQALSAFDGGSDIRLSNLELFLEYRQLNFSNSQGAHGTREGTSLLFDITVLASPLNSQQREAESHTTAEARRSLDVDTAAIVREQLKCARDSRSAVEPETLTGIVVLAGNDLPNLLSPFITHASAAMKYRQQSRFTVNKSFAGEETPLEGEPFNLFADATLPYGLGTVAFDTDGVPGQKVQLIENNIFRNYWASQRYATYLSVPATGYRGNTVVPPGQHSLQELLSGPGPIYYVVTLSALMPNDLSGDFVAEIKLGYEMREGQIVRVLKGGSVSGNVFSAFAQAAFAREVIRHAEYYGPVAIRFSQLAVSGV